MCWVLIIYMKKSLLIALFCFSFFPLVSFAHPGRTDSSGCHTCRTNCPNWGLSSGEYHCHNSKGVSQPKEPVKSTYGDNGTGYVTPAPEYKAPKTITPAKTEVKTSPTPVRTTTQINVKSPQKSTWWNPFSWFK